MTATHEYDEIIEMKYPLETTDTQKHPRMSRADRAKIFSPFAALKGYEEAIAAKQAESMQTAPDNDSSMYDDFFQEP
ncbi:MAG: hypothetical protein MR016_00660 [Agathobacter sp.]|nr:hypothetical protein [Agathobacter sp.]